MSYREENGVVILSMSPHNHSRLLMALGMATTTLSPEHPFLLYIFALIGELTQHAEPNESA